MSWVLIDISSMLNQFVDNKKQELLYYEHKEY